MSQETFDGPGQARSPAPARSGPKVCCVVPCYNVAGLCGQVVNEAADYADAVVAVNDGSTDRTQDELQTEAARSPGGRVHLLTLARNGGKGGALLAGFQYALAHVPFDVLVTIDGDRQHRPADIPRLVDRCVGGGASMVIGERFGPDSGPVPLRSRVGNALAARVLGFRYPGCPRDTQSGLRAFHRDFVQEIVRRVGPGRYETELRILLLALGRSHTIGSVSIPTIYLDGNRRSHFRPIRDGLRVYCAMFSRPG